MRYRCMVCSGYTVGCKIWSMKGLTIKGYSYRNVQRFTVYNAKTVTILNVRRIKRNTCISFKICNIHMHVLYNQIKGWEGRGGVGFRGITVIAGGGAQIYKSCWSRKFFHGSPRGRGGGVPRHIFANLISLNFPEGEG